VRSASPSVLLLAASLPAFAYAYVAPGAAPTAARGAIRFALMQQKQQQKTPSSGFRNPVGQAQIPVDQQPVVELQTLRKEPFYDWADTSDTYTSKLGDLYKGTMLFISLPIAYTTYNVLPNELPQIFLAANIGTFGAMLPFVLRLRVGWGFVSERLREKETYFEAQQRGLFARKDKEEIARDKLIYKTQVAPVLRRIDASIFLIAVLLGLSVVSGEVLALSLGEAGPSTLKTFVGQDARDITNRLRADDEFAAREQERARRKMKEDGTGVKPAYCDSRYYRILAGGNAQGGVGCNGQ